MNVKPMRLTIMQTSKYLNVAPRTVRRWLDSGRLKWSGDQVSMSSIEEELKSIRPKGEESEAEVEALLEAQAATQKQRRLISRGI